MSHRRLQSFAWATLGFNLLVILWGAYVRASGSGAGCGSHWPTCNGDVVPRDASVKTMVEFTHRATSGVALLMVLGLMVATLWKTAKGHPARKLAVLSLLFIVLEAGIGAGLVLFEWVAGSRALARGIVMPLHLANTFLLLGGLIFTCFHLGGRPAVSLFNTRPGSWRIWGAAAALMFAAMSGGIAALGDTLFPTTSFAEGVRQDLSSGAHLFLKLRALHPALAVLGAAAMFSLGGLARLAGGRARTFGTLLWGVTGAQVLAGLVNMLLLAPTAMQLVHLLLADGVWALFLLTVAETALAPAPVSVAGAEAKLA